MTVIILLAGSRSGRKQTAARRKKRGGKQSLFVLVHARTRMITYVIEFMCIVVKVVVECSHTNKF